MNDTPSPRRIVALVLMISAVAVAAAGLYLLLATSWSLVGGVLLAAGASDGLLAVFLLSRR